MNNNKFNVFNKINVNDRQNWYLIIDAIYKANPDIKNLGADVISKLFPVGVAGGFRYIGKRTNPLLIVLFTSGEDIYWKDEIDSTTGLLLYYGDNKTPGKELHETKAGGNLILKNIFDFACSEDLEKRKNIPPIFVFKKNNSLYDIDNTGSGRDVKFLGLAVPGIIGKPKIDWLTAVWGCNKDGDRFQNYKAYFTILDTSSGSNDKDGSGINLAWVTDIEKGNAYSSIYAPKVWKKYIDINKISPLTSRCAKFVRTKQEQLPQKKTIQYKMLKYIQEYFVTLDRGYSFESFACEIVKFLEPSIIDITTTNPYKDGGFDGVGKYRIFNKVENEVYVDFYLQAKCYNPESTPVTVKDTSRLISRIKDRQFGIMITTSYIAQQAYEEIIEDGHPVVIISGKNIVDYIFDKLQIKTLALLKQLLEKKYNNSLKTIYEEMEEDKPLAVASSKNTKKIINKNKNVKQEKYYIKHSLRK